MTMYGTVREVTRLTPSMLRIEFVGDGLADFEPTEGTDQYVNALFVPVGAPYTVPFDLDHVRSLDAEVRPRGRRYTVRRWDSDQRVLTIDVVAHGDLGFAGRWAQRAEPGDRLQMVGPSGSFRPDPAAALHLFVGDESALPAIGACLDVLPSAASAVVVAVVDSAEHEIDLASEADVDVRWLHRSTAPDPDTVVVDAVRSLDWPDGIVDVFVHGEAGEVRAVRTHLLADRGIDRAEASISPYWRRDHTDEAWREVKRQWLADQDTDV